jgi:hypothetical protein
MIWHNLTKLVLRTTYSDESNTLWPIALENLRRWVTQYFVHLNRLATNKSDSSVNEELGRRFILEEVDVDLEKINVPDFDNASQDDIKALTNVFDSWLCNAVGDVDSNAEFNIQDSARFCDFLVIDEGSLRSLATLPKETPSLELVSREERRVSHPSYSSCGNAKLCSCRLGTFSIATRMSGWLTRWP